MAATDFNHGVSVIDVDDGERVITTVKSAIIGVVGSAGKGDRNTATLVTSRRQAVQKFGKWDDRDGFTLPSALDAIFDQGSAQVIVINVTDEDAITDITSEPITLSALTHKGAALHRHLSDVAVANTITVKAKLQGEAPGAIALPAGVTISSIKSANGATTYVTTTDYTVANNKITRNASGAIPAGAELLIAYTATLVKNVDYSLDDELGIFTRIVGTGSKVMAGATITVDYTYVDASKVDQTDILGGVDTTNGQYTGVHALLSSKSTLRVAPRILIAPGWTHTKADAFTANPVIAELLPIASKLKAIIFGDGPNTTDEEAVRARGDWGSPRLMVIDPWVKRVAPSGATISSPPSAVFAGVLARVDREDGFWWSPSNREIFGIVGTTRAVEFALGDPTTRANYLNGSEVATIIYENGYRTWGNRSTSTDPKYAFLSTQRIADMVHESIMLSHMWAVDRNITKGLVDSIVEGVKNYLRYLKNLGAIVDGDVWADRDLNTPSEVAQGKLVIDFKFSAVYPAENIQFRSHLVDDYLVNIFDDVRSPLA